MSLSEEKKKGASQSKNDETVSDKIWTIPNFVSFVRLCLVPIYLILLIEGRDIAATVVFAIAASTDWVDGQIARRTNTVTKLGQLLDPAVDRILTLSGVIGLLYVGRLPIWIVIFVLLRDGIALIGGGFMLKRYRIRIPVVYAGKVATALLMAGFAGQLLNWPVVPGLGIVTASFLPGLNADPSSWGIFLVYIGLVFSFGTFVYYVVAALREKKKLARREREGGSE